MNKIEELYQKNRRKIQLIAKVKGIRIFNNRKFKRAWPNDRIIFWRSAKLKEPYDQIWPRKTFIGIYGMYLIF